MEPPNTRNLIATFTALDGFLLNVAQALLSHAFGENVVVMPKALTYHVPQEVPADDGLFRAKYPNMTHFRIVNIAGWCARTTNESFNNVPEPIEITFCLIQPIGATRYQQPTKVTFDLVKMGGRKESYTYELGPDDTMPAVRRILEILGRIRDLMPPEPKPLGGK